VTTTGVLDSWNLSTETQELECSVRPGFQAISVSNDCLELPWPEENQAGNHIRIYLLLSRESKINVFLNGKTCD
jgi:hypothetical protein